MPVVVLPWAERQSHFADDLRPHVQGGARGWPVLGQTGPRSTGRRPRGIWVGHTDDFTSTGFEDDHRDLSRRLALILGKAGHNSGLSRVQSFAFRGSRDAGACIKTPG